MVISQIEAFSCGKIHGSPQENEDAFVLVPERVYAVIDGATDRSGTRYNGMFAGRYASFLVKQTIEQEFLKHKGNLPAFSELLHAINHKIQAAYDAHGFLDKARENATYRFSAALALIEQKEDHIQLYTIGDCGIRINLSETIHTTKDLDHITALLRQAGWQYLEGLSMSSEEHEQASRRLCMQGLKAIQKIDGDLFDKRALSQISEKAFSQVHADLPHVPEALIRHLLEQGIIHGQHIYQNCDKTCLGYAAIDGFDIPPDLIGSRRIALDEIKSIELFSDGYFNPPSEFGIAAWEESHRMVEEKDPAKVRLWLGPKGTTSTQWTDDRTYLGIKCRA
ncbi:MAG: hypothetical protein EB015_13850 [Methylocystaceae bacterium]|nr:hypothetical protein [Methylocystaceae bacterium]